MIGLRSTVVRRVGPALLLATSAAPLLAQNLVTGDASIVFPSSQVQLLFDGAYFTEGPAVAPDGSVFFSDITVTNATDMEAGHIWKYDPATGATTIFRSPSGMANGILFADQGRMIVAEGADFGGRRITRTDLTTGKSVIIAGLYEGKAFNAPNDLALDEEGRIYFTDPRYLGHEPVEQPVEGIYRIDPNGTVTLLAGELDKPNGILVSPNQRILYVACVGGTQQAIFAYDLAADGSVSGRKELIDFSPGAGPDGMTIDVDGNIYAARSFQPRGIYVYAPDGQQLALIPTPEQPTNVTFGRGSGSRTLFITAGRSLYSVEVKKDGYHAGRW